MNGLITLAAQYLIYVIGFCFLAFSLLRLPTKSRLHFALALVCSLIIGFVLAKLAGALYTNPRPFVVDGVQPLFPHTASNGFPSNHMLMGTILALLMWRYNRGLSILLLGMTTLVGLARVVANVHHLQDIMAGFIIAAIAVALSFAAADYLAAKRTSSLQ